MLGTRDFSFNSPQLAPLQVTAIMGPSVEASNLLVLWLPKKGESCLIPSSSVSGRVYMYQWALRREANNIRWCVIEFHIQILTICFVTFLSPWQLTFLLITSFCAATLVTKIGEKRNNKEIERIFWEKRVTVSYCDWLRYCFLELFNEMSAVKLVLFRSTYSWEVQEWTKLLQGIIWSWSSKYKATTNSTLIQWCSLHQSKIYIGRWIIN